MNSKNRKSRGFDLRFWLYSGYPVGIVRKYRAEKCRQRAVEDAGPYTARADDSIGCAEGIGPYALRGSAGSGGLRAARPTVLNGSSGGEPIRSCGPWRRFP